MEIKLEYIIATAVAAIICGSVNYQTMAPIEVIAEKACRKISPRIRAPIEETITRIYEEIISTKEGIGRLLYPNNSPLYCI
jgi:hypothetical protein